MMKHFGSLQDKAADDFDKLKQSAGQVQAMRTAVDSLLAQGDTVTTKDVVKAASGIVAAGIPAVDIATMLSEMPDKDGAQLQAWVQERAEGVAAMEQQLGQAIGLARVGLLKASLENLVAHSAEGMARRANIHPGNRSIN